MTDDMTPEEQARLDQDVQDLLATKGKDSSAAADAREVLADERLNDVLEDYAEKEETKAVKEDLKDVKKALKEAEKE